MKLKLIQLLLMVLLLILFESGSLFAQVYSEGLSHRRSARGYFELKVIETDPVLKQTKEMVPFDRPFFLKIKRLSVGKTIDTTRTTTIVLDTTRTVDMGSGVEVKQSRNLKKEVTKTDKKVVMVPAEIDTIMLVRTLDSHHLNCSHTAFAGNIEGVASRIYKHAHYGGKIYQESPKSKFIYIELDKLRPGNSYELRIDWKNNGKTESERYHFSTIASKIEERAKQKLSPQLGLASSFFNNGGEVSQNFSLFFAVYYHFRSIDPEIPSKAYTPFAWQRFSVMLGVTLNSLAEEGIRDDLFSSNNLLIGVGYQPVDGIRLSSGFMLFNDIGPNTLLADNKKIAGTPYTSVTVDLKLKDLLGGIVSTLGFK